MVHPTPPARLAAAMLVAVAGVARAQAPALIQLAKPPFAFSQTFSNIGFIRELPGQRVLVIDSRERTLTVIDTGGRQAEVGGSGSGPGEYLAPIGLFAAPADSTIVYDVLNQRSLLLDRRGVPAGIERIAVIDAGIERPLRQTAPAFGDRDGRLYARGYPSTPGSLAEDSAALVRYDRSRHRADTLGFLRLPALIAITTRSADGSIGNSRGYNPFTMRDGWAAGHDGRVALVHAAPYRVEWLRADRSRVIGPVIPYERVRVSEADKAFVTDPQNQKRVGGTGPGSERLPDRMPAPQFTSWPEFKPPFIAESPRIAPDGRLWVERSRAFTDSVRTFDVFDERGTLAERVALPPNRKLVGFGASAIYLSYADADDLEHLERYARRF
jgi:hypothetical protein